MSDRRVWAAFLLLALAWGTSFLFIKVALRTVGPFTLVSARLLIGWIGLMVIMRWQGLALPRDRRIWVHLLVMGAVNVAVPFVLISWAESGVRGVDSGVASVVNSTVPLFSIVFSGVLLRAESVAGSTILGLLVGFAGVVLLVDRNLAGQAGALAPYGAVVLAAACYAAASAYGRRYLAGLRPVVVSAGQLFAAATLAVTATFFAEDIGRQSFTATAVVALLWLGLLGSCLAYILYFFILQQWGATRTTLVTYLIPVVGVSAGVIFLDEAISWRLLAGGALILGGVGVVNARWRSIRAEGSGQ